MGLDAEAARTLAKAIGVDEALIQSCGASAEAETVLTKVLAYVGSSEALSQQLKEAKAEAQVAQVNHGGSW